MRTGVARDGRDPALAGLRGLAALGVFLVHAYALAGFPVWSGHPTASFLGAWPMRMGWAGVDVFFTLSAFLLALPYARAAIEGAEPPGLRGYAARRFLRIVPAYAVQLLVMLALVAAGAATVFVSQDVTVPRLLVQPVFLYDIGWPGRFAMQWPLVGSWWTLPVEIGFYVALPFLARWLRPGRWPWLLLLVACAWIWRAALLWTQPFMPTTVFLADHLPGRIDQFAIGMLAAYAACREPASLAWVRGRRADAVFVIAALAFLALPALGYIEGWPVGAEPRTHVLLIGWHTYASLAVAAMLLAAVRAAPLAGAIVGSAPLRMLGALSYGFYLWHLPVLLALGAAGGVAAAGGPVAFIACGLLVSLLVAGLSWWFVERPAMRIAARWPRDPHARMPTPVPVRAP